MSPLQKSFTAKATWHRQQRTLSPKEKVRIVIELQHRATALNPARVSIGRPPVAMVPWRTRP